MADINYTETQVGLVHPDQATLFDGVAAEAINAGQPVYFNSAGKIALADANAAGLQQARGIALYSRAAGQAITCVKEGDLYGYDLSGMAYDAIAYLSDTVGRLADAAGTMTVRIGRVVPLTNHPTYTKVLHVSFDWNHVWS
jgi:hypothetical protein